MEKFKLIILLINLLNCKLFATGDTCFYHKLNIMFDNLSSSSINNLNRKTVHEVSFDFYDSTDVFEYRVRRSFEVIRNGKVSLKELYSEQTFLRQRDLSFGFSGCFLLPGDSFIITIEYELYHTWKLMWSDQYKVKKGFLINSAVNYPFNHFELELEAYINDQLLKIDEIKIVGYKDGEPIDTFIRRDGDKYFYDDKIYSAAVTLKAEDLYWNYSLKKFPLYGGKLAFGRVYKEKHIVKQLTNFYKEEEKFGMTPLLDDQLFISPFLIVRPKDIRSYTDFLILFDHCAATPAGRSISRYSFFKYY